MHRTTVTQPSREIGIAAPVTGYLSRTAVSRRSGARTRRGVPIMGMGDKAENAVQKAEGQVKETVGEHTDDESLEAEGKKDQMAGDLKNAGEKVKDAFKD